MIFRTRFQVLLLAASVLMAAPTFAAGKEIIAQVGVIPITVYELEREQQKIMPFNVNFHGGISDAKKAEIREQALQKLIERAYKVQYALTEELAVDNDALEKHMKSVVDKYKTKKELEKAAGSEGIKGYRASAYRQLLSQKAEERAVEAKIKVKDEDVLQFYESNKATYKRPKQFKASHILIKVDPSSNKEEMEALLKKAKELVIKAKSGEDFYNLAYYNSDDRSKYVGGDLGYFHVGQTVKEFEDALLTMKVGEISEPVRSMYGYHIIKLDEVNESRQLSFDEVKDKIRETLAKKQRDATYEKWMTELKAKYPVQRF